MTKVFVGNFSFSVKDEQLKEYFGTIGPVLSAKVMTEGPGGRSRGFGFVEFATEEEATRAIADLNGKVWDGREIKVSEDRSHRQREERARAGGSSGHSSSGGGYGNQGSSGPTGYFRAQPLDLGIRKTKKKDPFELDEKLFIDYKDPKILGRYMSERGRILPRRMTGLSSSNQRLVARAIKRAQHLALLPYLRR